MSGQVREPHYGAFALEEQPESINEALKLSGLDWEVASKPAYYLDNPEELDEAEDPDEIPLLVNPVEGYFVNVRSDTGLPLGVVTKRYSTFHNVQAFGFLTHIFQSEMDFIAAGDFMNSRRVWVMMRIPEFIEVGGDEIGQNAFIHTSHDGKHSVTASMTPVRWLSAAFINAEIRRAKAYNADRTIALRHTGDMEGKIAEMEAERVLNVTVNYYGQFKALGDNLASKRATKRDADSYVEALLPIDEDQGDLHERRRQEARTEILRIFRGEGKDGDTRGNSPDTWWSLYCSAIEYADYGRNERKKGGSFQRAIDDPDGFKTEAFELALVASKL
jgi:phage/plasmid-like protein (TIGR03299 family)